MKKQTAALTALISALTLPAQPFNGNRPGGRPPHVMEQTLDSNSDYTLDVTELAEAGNNLRRLDQDGDGELGKDEFEMPGPPGGFGPPTHPFAKALDRNGDEVIDRDEMAKAAESLLQLDENGDGRISDQESHPRGRPLRDGGGQRMFRAAVSGPAGQGGRPGRAQPTTNPEAVQRFMSLDRNGDDVITRNEVPDRLADLMLADADGDGHVSRSEARFFVDRLRPAVGAGKRRKRGF